MNEIVNRIKQLKTFKEYDPKVLVDDAHKIGKKIAKQEKVTHTSLRNVHSEIVRITSMVKSDDHEAEALSRIKLLKPKVSYLRAKAKERNQKGLKELENIMEASVDKISGKEDVLKFKDFFDSILMYHKAEGGD